MIGARIEMRLNVGDDLFGFAPTNERIDESVRTAVGEIFVGESELFSTARVLGLAAWHLAASPLC
jgi:hypothetical protein